MCFDNSVIYIHTYLYNIWIYICVYVHNWIMWICMCMCCKNCRECRRSHFLWARVLFSLFIVVVVLFFVLRILYLLYFSCSLKASYWVEIYHQQQHTYIIKNMSAVLCGLWGCVKQKTKKHTWILIPIHIYICIYVYMPLLLLEFVSLQASQEVTVGVGGDSVRCVHMCVLLNTFRWNFFLFSLGFLLTVFIFAWLSTIGYCCLSCDNTRCLLSFDN